MPNSNEMWNMMRRGLSKSTKTEIKENIEKDKEEVDMAKKTTVSTATSRKSIDTPLDETEALLKKKVSINELNEYLESQEERQKKRDTLKAKAAGEVEEENKPSPLAEIFAEAPDRLEKMSPDAIMKLSMLANAGKGGGMNPLLMLLLMGEQNRQPQQTQQTSPSILDLVKALKELKSLTSEEKKVSNEGNDMNQAIMLLLMERLMRQPNAPPPQPNQNQQLDLVKYLTSLLAEQNKLRESVLTDKLRQLEYQVSKYDPMEEGAKMIEYMKSFKTLFGGNLSPDALKHELELKKLEIEQDRESRRQDDDDRKMERIGKIIEKSVDTLSSTLAEPIAKGLEERIGRGKSTTKRMMNEDSEDIDLDDVDLSEYDESDYSVPRSTVPQSETSRRRNLNRFRVLGTDHEEEESEE